MVLIHKKFLIEIKYFADVNQCVAKTDLDLPSETLNMGLAEEGKLHLSPDAQPITLTKTFNLAEENMYPNM